MSRLLKGFGMVLVASMLVASPVPTPAATLRSRVVIHGDDVKLSDLFTGLQPGQDCAIGPAPAPGQHVVVPASQLAAIASEFGIEWEPSTGYQAAIIERRSRLVSRDEVLGVITPALFADGVSSTSDISISAFVPPALPEEMVGSPDIQTLDYDAQGGRFAATLVFQAADLQPVTIRIVGRVTEMISVLALSHPLPAGAVLSDGDVRLIRLPAASVHGKPVTDADSATGMALKRPLGEDAPILDDILTRPMLVERGRSLVLRLEAGGLALTAAGTALESGARGDRIHVMNSLSHAILVGEVQDAADIEIEPGTAPLFAQAGAAPGVENERGWRNSAQEAQSQ